MIEVIPVGGLLAWCLFQFMCLDGPVFRLSELKELPPEY